MGNYILQIVILLLTVLGVVFWKFSNIPDKWERALTLPFIIIAAGTPIIFTSLTRSVFEVSKLLNFRLNLIAIFVILLTRAIIKKQPLKIQKTPLNLALLVFALVNILATIFSDNQYVAIIGAYDRWEGLITEFNYIMYVFFFINFVRNKQAIYWLIGVLLVSAILSGFYGMLQSFGLDFMNWSADAQPRAFGCINNPVHYAPYIIMHIPLLAGLLFHLVKTFSPENFSIKKQSAHKPIVAFIWLQLVCLALLFYAGPLISFGRAAWIGFAFSLSFLLYFLVTDFKTNFIKDFFFIIYINFVTNYLFVFKIQAMNSLALLTSVALLIGIILFLLLNLNNIKDYLAYCSVAVFAGLLQFASVSYQVVIWLAAIIVFLYFIVFRHSISLLESKLKLSIIIAFLLIPVCLSYESIFATIKLDIYQLRHPQKVAASTTWGNLIKLEKEGTIALSKKSKNTFSRTDSYSTQFGINARISMWQSAIDWWLDTPKNFLLGTGPGTIKEMYPKYRRADYGRKEGGQNFTPDKLHNDYFNLLVTRGLLGFVVYYLWLIPLAFYIILKTIHTDKLNNGSYILVGLFAGMFAYLGQVLFNFGVVATRVIFYEFFCLALVIVFYRPFDKSEDKH